MNQPYQKISDAEYHALPYLSQSKLKPLLNLTWAHYLKAIESQEPKKHLDFGTLMHQAFLEKLDLSTYDVIEKLDGRTAKGKAQAKELEESGSKYLFKSDYEAATAILHNLSNNYEVQELMGYNGLIEHFGVVEFYNQRQPEHPVLMKFKPDFVGPSFLMDFKTTSTDISDHELQKVMRKYNYHFQAAAYLLFDSMLTGNLKQTFYIIFAETNPPYGTRRIELFADDLQRGLELFQLALQRFMKMQNDETKQTANMTENTVLPMFGW